MPHLIAPLWPSIPPTASSFPMVDFRGRVRCVEIWDRRPGIRCHLNASITSCWHSFAPHSASTWSTMNCNGIMLAA